VREFNVELTTVAWAPTSYNLVLALCVVLPRTPQPGRGLRLLEPSAPDAAACRRVPTRLPPPPDLRPHVPSGGDSFTPLPPISYAASASVTAC